MKRYLLALIIPAAMTFTLSLSPKASAEVNINIGVNAPMPGVVIASPPELFVIPGSYIYFIPDLDDDVFFYHGYWYRPYRGQWHRAGDYNGPWVVISISRVPGVLINLSPGFRRDPYGHERIPWGQVKKHWRGWEEERHWEKAEHKQHKEEGKGHKGHGKGKGHRDD